MNGFPTIQTFVAQIHIIAIMVFINKVLGIKTKNHANNNI